MPLQTLSYAAYFEGTWPDPTAVLNTQPDYTDGVNVYSPSFDPGGGGTVPAASDVRFGVAVGAGTGLAYIPTAAEVLLGVNVDQTTGNVRLPPETNVLLGYSYGPNDTLTGELDPGSGTCFGYPSETEVLSGVVFGNASEFTGNRTDALESDVRLGVQYAANGISKTGTWNGETGDPGDQTWIGQ